VTSFGIDGIHRKRCECRDGRRAGAVRGSRRAEFKGDSVKFDISGQATDDRDNQFIQALAVRWFKASYDATRYLLLAACFSTLNLDMLEAYRSTDLRLRHFFEYFILEQIYLQHRCH
jgi:hypothetical protein